MCSNYNNTIVQTYTWQKCPITSQKVISWRSERLKLILPALRAPGRNERLQFLVLNQPSLICQPGWMCVRLFLDLNTACIMFDLRSMCKPIVQAWNYRMDNYVQSRYYWIIRQYIYKSKIHSCKFWSVFFYFLTNTIVLKIKFSDHTKFFLMYWFWGLLNEPGGNYKMFVCMSQT